MGHENKFYLGDSVYAEVEGGQIILTTENGFGPSNTIYLDEYTYEALVLYVDKRRKIGAEDRDKNGCET